MPCDVPHLSVVSRALIHREKTQRTIFFGKLLRSTITLPNFSFLSIILLSAYYCMFRREADVTPPPHNKVSWLFFSVCLQRNKRINRISALFIFFLHYFTCVVGCRGYIHRGCASWRLLRLVAILNKLKKKILVFFLLVIKNGSWLPDYKKFVKML